MLEILPQFATLAVAVGVISLTLTKGSIFEWLRELLESQTDSPVFEWLAELFDCPYCMSHWVAMLAMFIYQPMLIETGPFLANWVVSWCVLIALASLTSGLIMRLFR